MVSTLLEIVVTVIHHNYIITDPEIEHIYKEAKKKREIFTLKEAQDRYGWKLEEVKETLFKYFGQALMYYLVSSTVDGGFVQPEDSFEWKMLKFGWRQHKKEVFKNDKHIKYSDFDINVSFLDGSPASYKGGVVTPSGLKIDMYPYKGERGILINPEIEQIKLELNVNPYIIN
jgi:hypothetical protein